MHRLRASFVVALLTAAAAGGCAGPSGASLRQLRTRAVFDLGCAEHQLLVYHVDERTKVVAGCGRRLVYVESCERMGGRDACTFVLDTPTFDQAQWPEWQRRASSVEPPAEPPLRDGTARPGGGRPIRTHLFEPDEL